LIYFNNERDDELYQYVKNIGLDNEYRIQGVENYIKSINNVIKLISSENELVECFGSPDNNTFKHFTIMKSLKIT